MFYFFNIVIVLYNLVLYANFRSGIYDYLRFSKMSKTFIKNHRKGFKNYWLYKAIHEQNSLGILYYLNLVFFTSTVIFSSIALMLGFVKVFQPLILSFSMILFLMEIPMTMLASTCQCKLKYNKAFVWLAKDKERKHFYSSWIDILSCFVTGFLIWLSYQQL